MPFPDPGSYEISNKDAVSFTFDKPQYDINKPIFIDPIDPARHITYGSAKDYVQRLVAGLHAAGLQPGDTVCLHTFNSIYFPLFVLAIIGAGGISIGTNPGYTRGELNHAVKVAKVRFVLAEPEILPNMLQALRENEIDVGNRLFILDTQQDQKVPAGFRTWRELLKHGKRDWIRFDDAHMSKNTVAQLYYTSGTTGLPKCAMTTHQNLIAEHQLYFEANPRSYPHRAALCMPFFHAGVQPQVVITTIKNGMEIYVMRRFELQPFLRYHPKYQLTEVFIVPPMVNAIVMSGLSDPASPNYRPEFSLRSVRHGTTGAAPCSGDIQKRFTRLLGDGATFIQIWGMTETTSVATMVPWDVARKCSSGEMNVWGTVGKSMPSVHLKLIDENGRDVTDQGKGELCIKAPTVVKGYFDNKEATERSWDAEGYFLTGDVAQVDKETGLIYIVDRVKELIKVRGFQCAPAELEGVLTEHKAIVDAAVIGISVSADEEQPRAYIVRRPGSTLTTDQVHQHMQARLARFKQLTGGVEFVDSIPKSPSGKILRRVLREQAKQEIKSVDTPKL